MAIMVCDFSVIWKESNTPAEILAKTNPNIDQWWEVNFWTGGSEGEGILILMVKGFTETNTPAPVLINGTTVGNIFPYSGLDSNLWFTQVIHIESGILMNEQANSMVIYRVPNVTFYLSNIICLFRQKA